MRYDDGVVVGLPGINALAVIVVHPSVISVRFGVGEEGEMKSEWMRFVCKEDETIHLYT